MKLTPREHLLWFFATYVSLRVEEVKAHRTVISSLIHGVLNVKREEGSCSIYSNCFAQHQAKHTDLPKKLSHNAHNIRITYMYYIYAHKIDFLIFYGIHTLTPMIAILFTHQGILLRVFYTENTRYMICYFTVKSTKYFCTHTYTYYMYVSASSSISSSSLFYVYVA